MRVTACATQTRRQREAPHASRRRREFRRDVRRWTLRTKRQGFQHKAGSDMAEANWFYVRAGQQQGPTDLQSLSDLIRRGEIQPTDLVWRDGMPDWTPATQVPELAYAGPAP